MRQASHRAGCRSVGEGVAGLRVLPFQVEPHVQGAIGDLRQRRVLVAHEALERTAAQAQQPEAPDARGGLDTPGPRQLDARHRPLWAGGGEGPRAACGVRHIHGRHLQALHLGIAREERLGKKQAIPFEIVAIEVEGLALDEVLHRVGRDEVGIVAGRVGRPERVSIEEHRHVRGKDGAGSLRNAPIAMQAIRRHIGLAVVVALPATRESFHAHLVRRRPQVPCGGDAACASRVLRPCSTGYRTTAAVPSAAMTMEEINRMDLAAFVAAVGSVFEHSPWVAERALDPSPVCRPALDARRDDRGGT